MTRLGLILRSLIFRPRRHAAVIACTALSTAAITGSLLVGGSVDGSLRALEELRTGHAGLSMRTPGRFFRAALAREIEADVGVTASPLLALAAVAGREDEDESIPGVKVLGVDERFFSLGAASPGVPAEEHAVLSRALARALRVKPGDELILRAEKPSDIPADLPLAVDSDVRLTVTVDAIATDEQMGRFDLRAEADEPLLAFVPLQWLSEKASVGGRANILLVREGVDAARAQESLRKHFRLEDAGLELRSQPDGGAELTSQRILLDEPVARAAEASGGRAVLAWFVQAIRTDAASVPYSMVAGIQAGAAETDSLLQKVWVLKSGEVVINEWLAEALRLQPGDTLSLDYDVFGLARRMERRTTPLRVAAVVPMTGLAADSTLMPFVPGLSDVANCRDWNPGFPVDTGALDPKDEQYWNEHRGTPKLFLRIDDASRLFGSRYGERTAFRFAQPPADLAHQLTAAIDPAALGFSFVPVQQVGAAVDFGPLFGGFSFVLVVSALLLTALLFSFGIEERGREVGTLRALGFRSLDIRLLLLGEASVLAVAGSLIGVPAGLLYTRTILTGLSTVWRDAAGLPTLSLHVTNGALILGGAIGTVASLTGLFLVLRSQLRVETRTLLVGPTPMSTFTGRSRRIAIALATSAVLLLLLFGRRPGPQAAEVFFGAGALLLIAGLFGADTFLSAVARSKAQAKTFSQLALSSAARRRGRSLTTIALIATGAFLVVGVGGGRLDPRQGADRRGSGTGGFALVAESTRPIARDLNSSSAREQVGLGADLPASFASLRVHDGDDASCRSPGRPVVPRIYGVDPAALQDRQAFTFTSGKSWSALSSPEQDGAIPAIGDEGTVIWSLHLGLGDALELTDARGKPIRLRIVGITATSVLQGGLIISEEQLVAHFPTEGGYRLLLVDAAPSEAAGVAAALSDALRDQGLRVMPAWRRLASFQSVENTYLAIFQTLGALGLMFGCLGIAVLVMRHALERRSELAVMEALGFTPNQLRLLFIAEHATLVFVGLVNGVASAIVCLIPMLRGPGMPVPVGSIVVDLLAIAVAGVAAATVATWLALRGPIVRGLQVEA